jgi:hypothetical protein
MLSWGQEGECMSAPVGWIGVQGMDRERILEATGLVEAQPGKRLKASMWSLPNGWTFVLTVDFDFPTPERMAALSAEGRAVALSADDRPMFSVVRGYERGKALFAIEHDGGQQGVRHMETAGMLPAEWPAILDRLSREQDDEDAGDADVDCLFDAPLELAKALCGYRHDEVWPEGQEPDMTSLAEKKSSGLIGRLFGKS